MKSFIQKTNTPTHLTLLALIFAFFVIFFSLYIQHSSAQNMEGNGDTSSGTACQLLTTPCGPQGDNNCIVQPQQWVEYFGCGARGDETCTRPCGPSLIPPVSGSCGSPAIHYQCTLGTPANMVQNDSTWQWTWSCNGSNGGTNASCSEARPNQTPFVFAGVDLTLRQPSTTVTVRDATAFDR